MMIQHRRQTVKKVRNERNDRQAMLIVSNIERMARLVVNNIEDRQRYLDLNTSLTLYCTDKLK